MGELFLPGPQPPAFPLEQFQSRKSAWQLTLLPDRPTAPSALPPDLASQANWARMQAEEAQQERLVQAIAEEDARLAEVRAEAVRSRQEALNNAGLDLTVPDREMRAVADKERRRLWQQVEAEVVVARADGEARLTRVRERIAAETREAIAAAEADAWRRMGTRAQILVKSGSETRTRMSKAMAPPERLAMGSQFAWEPEGGSGPDSSFGPATSDLGAREARLRGEQAARLVARRAAMARELETAVSLAVQRLAGRSGVTVRFPPSAGAKGPDLTEEFRPPLRAMFQP